MSGGKEYFCTAMLKLLNSTSPVMFSVARSRCGADQVIISHSNNYRPEKAKLVTHIIGLGQIVQSFFSFLVSAKYAPNKSWINAKDHELDKIIWGHLKTGAASFYIFEIAEPVLNDLVCNIIKTHQVHPPGLRSSYPLRE